VARVPEEQGEAAEAVRQAAAELQLDLWRRTGAATSVEPLFEEEGPPRFLIHVAQEDAERIEPWLPGRGRIEQRTADVGLVHLLHRPGDAAV
jgi:hypothetical protein